MDKIDYQDDINCVSLNKIGTGGIKNVFKPPELLDHFTAVSLEREDEVLMIWSKYIIGLFVCKEETDMISRNIGALMFITMDHVEQTGRIDSNTLFKYMDFFSNALYDKGVSIKDIRKVYLPVLKGIIECFKEKIVDSNTGERYKLKVKNNN